MGTLTYIMEEGFSKTTSAVGTAPFVVAPKLEKKETRHLASTKKQRIFRQGHDVALRFSLRGMTAMLNFGILRGGGKRDDLGKPALAIF